MPVNKILSISSFAVHGSASLKLLLSKYSKHILPVPSALFSALTNHPLHTKLPLDFEKLLESTLEIVQDQNQNIVLHVGYLNDAAQVKIIHNLYQKFKKKITAVVVDPVMGDHGKWYVDPELLPAWKFLIDLADYTTPNYTELKLLCGFKAEEEVAPALLISNFKALFPNCNLIATSMPGGNKLNIHAFEEGYNIALSYPKHQQNMGGTGDLFTAAFIVHKYFKQYPFKVAVDNAHGIVHKAIGKAIKKNKSEISY